MLARKHAEPFYPDSDGKPVANNTVQCEEMITIKCGLDLALPDFVAMDLFWYPVRGAPEINQAPDVLVAVGRPKGPRGSYKQWEEDDIAPQVVFEVISPGNNFPEMARKLLFYLKYGVEEYYILDPDEGTWTGYLRRGQVLDEIPDMDDFVSPRLGVRFGYDGDKPVLFHANGERFQTFSEIAASAAEAGAQVVAERQRAETERQRAETERQRAETERQRAETERQRADALAERLRAMGVEL